jgi:preprotein translocase subunit YajC
MDAIDTFFSSKIGMFIYVVLFIIFYFFMDYRVRILKKKVENAMNGIEEIHRLTKNALNKK